MSDLDVADLDGHDLAMNANFVTASFDGDRGPGSPCPATAGHWRSAGRDRRGERNPGRPASLGRTCSVYDYSGMLPQHYASFYALITNAGLEPDRVRRVRTFYEPHIVYDEFIRSALGDYRQLLFWTAPRGQRHVVRCNRNMGRRLHRQLRQ